MSRGSVRGLVAVVFLVVGCSGRTESGPGRPPTDGGSGRPPTEPACTDGQTRKEDCNTCTCSDGNWVCTDSVCGFAVCREGDTKPSESGCGGCTCQGGQWLCSLILCTPACTEGQTKPAGDGCNACSCIGEEWVCTQKACPPKVCTDGETKAAGDGCNTCSCIGSDWACTKNDCKECDPAKRPNDGCNQCSCYAGQWACTLKNCPPPDACNEGETKAHADSCNTCSCSKGVWVCSSAACSSTVPKGCGARLGNTCTGEEYCAYTEGKLCGAADASAECRRRPPTCPGTGSPVCGCDGKTYPNACFAAQAGTGVNATGACIPR